MRFVHEAAGIVCTMAESSLKIADQWMAGQRQPNKKARQFVANVMYAASFAWLSQWAHVSTTIALNPYVKESEDGDELPLSQTA